MCSIDLARFVDESLADVEIGHRGRGGEVVILLRAPAPVRRERRRPHPQLATRRPHRRNFGDERRFFDVHPFRMFDLQRRRGVAGRLFERTVVVLRRHRDFVAGVERRLRGVK